MKCGSLKTYVTLLNDTLVPKLKSNYYCSLASYELQEIELMPVLLGTEREEERWGKREIGREREP